MDQIKFLYDVTVQKILKEIRYMYIAILYVNIFIFYFTTTLFGRVSEFIFYEQSIMSFCFTDKRNILICTNIPKTNSPSIASN